MSSLGATGKLDQRLALSLPNQSKSSKSDFPSPINCQLEVRDADVVVSTIQLNLGLRKQGGYGEVDESGSCMLCGKRKRAPMYTYRKAFKEVDVYIQRYS